MTKKYRGLLIAGAAGLILSLVCLIWAMRLGTLLTSQQESVRWKGESDVDFCQLSVFLPEDGKKNLEDIYAFRSQLSEALHRDSLDTDKTITNCVDAWCAFGKLNAASDLASGKMSVIAVGGDYFLFHPLHLISGSYISPDDLMQDRILLDEDSAWLLFGGTGLEGMSVNISGQQFTVAGVVERETDRFSKAAYDSGMGIYMSYETFCALSEDDFRQAAEISCYELVMPQPVKGYAYGLVSEKFPVGSGEVVDNTRRFLSIESLKRLKTISRRSMHTSGVSYPYWENAARAAEDRCTVLYTLTLAFAVLPLVIVVSITVLALKSVGRKLSEDVLPDISAKTREAIRVRQRRGWEKRHPGKY